MIKINYVIFWKKFPSILPCMLILNSMKIQIPLLYESVNLKQLKNKNKTKLPHLQVFNQKRHLKKKNALLISQNIFTPDNEKLYRQIQSQRKNH